MTEHGQLLAALASGRRLVVLNADILRDGGSLIVELEVDNSAWTLMLQVEPWEHPSELAYGSLLLAPEHLGRAHAWRCLSRVEEQLALETLQAAQLSTECGPQGRARLAQLVEVLRLRRSSNEAAETT